MSSKISSEIISKILSDESDVREASSPHQRDFPYQRDEEAQVTRREFCNFLAVTSSALFLGAAGFATKAMLEANATESFSPMQIEDALQLKIGESLNFRYPTENDTAILIRTRDGKFYAYGQKCTHLACPVYFEREKEQLECPCHEGGFDARTGNVLYGPPPRPLDRVELEVKSNGEVWAIGRIAGGVEENA